MGTQESHPRPTTRPPVGKTLKDSLPEKRFDDEFFVAVDWLRKQSGRKKRWARRGKLERSAPLPEAAAGADEPVPDPMLLGELRAIRRWNRWLAARGHAAASVVFRRGDLSIESAVVELRSPSLWRCARLNANPIGSSSRTRPRATTYVATCFLETRQSARGVPQASNCRTARRATGSGGTAPTREGSHA
jgi:hypothetical protein